MIRVESTRLDATGAGANGTVATSISETAVAGYHTVAGYYYDASNKSRGFLYNGTTYTTLDGPSATQTYIWGIDGTNVVGMYTDGTGNHGFIYNGSVFTTVDNPAGDPGSTVVTGISGDTLVGTYWDPTASQKAGFMATPIPLSPNANLAALALSEGTLSPAFASNTVSYTATVPNATTSITVTPTVAQANATVTVNGTPSHLWHGLRASELGAGIEPHHRRRHRSGWRDHERLHRGGHPPAGRAHRHHAGGDGHPQLRGDA